MANLKLTISMQLLLGQNIQLQLFFMNLKSKDYLKKKIGKARVSSKYRFDLDEFNLPIKYEYLYRTKSLNAYNQAIA